MSTAKVRKLSSSTQFDYTVNLSSHGQILAVHQSPYEYSQDVIIIAFANELLAATVSFQDKFEFKELTIFNHLPRCNAIALSPETCLTVLPASLLFCTASYDFKLRIFESNLKESTCKVLSGHTSYINDISFDPANNYLASVSDDQTARIWSTDQFDCVATLILTSAGVSVHWHKEDGSKLLVAEKLGLVRFYNVDTQTPILSLDCGKPLSSAHWSPADSQLVGTLQLGELLLWDLTRPSRPSHAKLLCTESGGYLRFGHVNELIGVVNQLDATLKVLHIPTMQERLNVQVCLPSNLTWHFRFPIVCIGDDGRLCFWKVSHK